MNGKTGPANKRAISMAQYRVDPVAKLGRNNKASILIDRHLKSSLISIRRLLPPSGSVMENLASRTR